MKFQDIVAAALVPAAFVGGITAAALQSLATVPEPVAAQCGTPHEDARRCVREGAQAVGMLVAEEDRGTGRVAVAAADCPKESRDCFPEDRVG